MTDPTDSRTTAVTLGNRSFILDHAKAEQAFQAKQVVNGRQTPFFNILPLKYHWAYDLYKTMKANHWEPEDVNMQKDLEQWRGKGVTDAERWIIKLGIGYFSAAEGIVGDNILHVIRDRVTAPELKLLLGRHAHEENIHADSLVYMISALGINPHECEAIFEDVPSVRAKAEFVVNNSQEIRRAPGGFMDDDTIRAFAKNLFLFGQVMEGTQFYGLFGMILSLGRQNKMSGIATMFRYTLKDETSHVKGLRLLLLDLIKENQQIWTPGFRDELRETMREGVRLEKEFIRDCLPVASIGMNVTDFETYTDYLADRRLASIGLTPLCDSPPECPFPWLAEMMDLKKETNFFEGRVTDYQKSSSLPEVSDDEL
jgi:ribonucleoside-diphosphate reductase beta chain